MLDKTKQARRRRCLEKRKAEALELLGSKCIFCGSPEVQAAHVVPTPICGKNSRGSYRRWADVVKYPTHYRPMCPRCHRRFDALVALRLQHEASRPEEEIPF